eukprot:4897607-Alexandrium_andersonii.AAC.1
MSRSQRATLSARVRCAPAATLRAAAAQRPSRASANMARRARLEQPAGTLRTILEVERRGQ